ncbi:unannotated protein [freshwater metagenome]|uniref:Unannotated protein n=1 Tax=freshwater metagenome TaxID=449393 RepID=A0A6J7GL37_9ZZZZ
MNATMPSAVPRGPNLRTHTAANNTAMNPTSATAPSRESSAATVTAAEAGSTIRAVVTSLLCWSLSLTDADACIATTVPSIATVTGWPMARVASSRTTIASNTVSVVAEAPRSRNCPGSDASRMRARRFIPRFCATAQPRAARIAGADECGSSLFMSAGVITSTVADSSSR